MCESVDEFLARGGIIQQIPEDVKGKKKRASYKGLKVVLARTTVVHHKDGSKFVSKENFLNGSHSVERVEPKKETATQKDKDQRKKEQKDIAKGKGNHSRPRYWC